MTDTKEKILRTALGLFAEHGYEAVSVSMIAGKLGITKGALYKHYRSKRDIFDQIVARMYELDGEQSRNHQVPEETYEVSPDSYENLSRSTSGRLLLPSSVSGQRMGLLRTSAGCCLWSSTGTEKWGNCTAGASFQGP